MIEAEIQSEFCGPCELFLAKVPLVGGMHKAKRKIHIAIMDRMAWVGTVRNQKSIRQGPVIHTSHVDCYQ